MTTNDLKERIENQMVVCFKVCHPNDAESNRVADVFREFCRRETQNNYLQGIKKLLEAYSSDWKYETLHQEIMVLKEEVRALSQPKPEDKKAIKTFGGAQ